MDYTLDDLRGKWVRKYTPDCTLFLEQLHRLQLTSNVNENYFGGDVIAVCDGDVVCGLWIDENACLTDDRMFIPKPRWSIYTNDKPLCELSDEQAAALFNAWRGGAIVECCVLDDIWAESTFPEWKDMAFYRIKQKSERELFIEKCVESIKSHNSDDPAYYEEWFEQLFNAGCRFTKDN